MTEAVATDMHTFEVTYTERGPANPPTAEKITALYWQAGNDSRGDDKRFVYFKDYRHRTVFALHADAVVSIRMLPRAEAS
jgi:hypothetical protein